MGQDTVQTAVYRGKTYWFFGDTDRPAFPLGNFHTTGATSPPPAGLKPEVGVDLTYFADGHGFVRPMVDMKAGTPIWIDALMVVDHAGQSRLLARYARRRLGHAGDRRRPAPVGRRPRAVRAPGQVPDRRGAAAAQQGPCGSTTAGTTTSTSPTRWARVRVLADWDHVTDPAAYEAYDGTAWHRGGKEARPSPLRSAADDKPVRPHAGTISWNAYRKRWVMLLEQQGGTSNIGEMWYAEADHPEGPWGPAVKVATHAAKDDNDDFYNPMQHPEWDAEGGRVIYFEGTYVNTFSGNPFATPRYNYNQLVYRLDLADERLRDAER